MSDNSTGISIETRAVQPWQQEQDFRESLYEWMNATPWVMLSLAAHLLLFFIAATIPWQEFKPAKGPIIAVQPPVPIEEVVEIPEPPPELVEVEEPEEPTLVDSTLVEDVDPAPDTSDSELDFVSDFPFEDVAALPEVGLGGRAGGGGGKGDGRDERRGRAGTATEQALESALVWLQKHQADDGSWDADGFVAECGEIGTNLCGGSGYPEHDVGVTGLALLAFLGIGDNSRSGPYQDVVRNGLRFLKSQQDPDSGLIGDRTSKEFIYNHVIATLAICEDYYFTKLPTLKDNAQRAVDFITRARDPYGVWRYDVPSLGEGDTSVTGWMVFALAAAKDAGLRVDEGAFASSLAFFDDMTDSANGRVGYLSVGSGSSRIPGVNQQFPVEQGEAMTAVTLLCRVFLGQDPSEERVMEKHADLLLRALPKWEPEENGCDMYYWYYGTYAMFQMGAHKNSYWSKWEDKLDGAVLQSQREDGDERGSWDPVGPWGFAGGRVYSTALMALTLEVKFRYDKVLGSR